MSLKVVKHPFKSNGNYYAVGSIIKDPSAIKLFKSKVREGKFIIVDEHNADEVCYYFKHKMGVDIEEALNKILYPKPPEAAKETEAPKATKKIVSLNKPKTSTKK